MKRIIAGIVLLMACCAQAEAVWRGLEDKNYYSGPKITDKDLAGKVVLVEIWGVNCGPCVASLPHMEALWKKFKSKPFLLIGSHAQGRQEEKVAALVKQYDLTYPIYDWVGLQGAPGSNGIPFMYVVNHRGKVVYSGRNKDEIKNAIENALKELGGKYNLVNGVTLKYYKTLPKQLVFGKPIKSIVSKLEKDIKRAESRFADEKAKAMAEEAKNVLAAIKDAKASIQSDIESLQEKDAAAAAKLKKAFDKTFP